jgi:acyl-CoA thioesterase-1
MKILLSTIAALVGLAVSAPAQMPAPAGSAAASQLGEIPGLPRILIIGDSIMGGYLPYVQQAFKYTANIVEEVPPKDNDRSSIGALAQMDTWLAGQQWAVIHFNWGLWDLKVIGENGRNYVPIEEYGKNVRELVQKMKRTGAVLIFATSTPVPNNVLVTRRRSSDVSLYNAVALKIMEENQVHIDDLYTLVLPRLPEFQAPNDVHFFDDGYRFLAQKVTNSIKYMLYLQTAKPQEPIAGSRL